MDQFSRRVLLNGVWECGENRVYSGAAKVPGLACDPQKINSGSLWYRKRLKLPGGKWNRSTLLLKGARFSPAVYINGIMVGRQNGGMAATKFELGKALSPLDEIELEIELALLSGISPEDASYIPVADQWRTNISSCLWDDVVLKLHGELSIDRLIPFYDRKSHSLTIHWDLKCASGKNYAGENYAITYQILDDNGVLYETCVTACQKSGKAVIALDGKIALWSPDEPRLYALKAIASVDGIESDTEDISLGLKQFEAQGLGFYLNDEKMTLRAGTLVWHRFLRDPEARDLAFGQDWFLENILLRLKRLGANCLRFHLGNPPEAFLDLCDKYGMAVQLEWHFFHGMTASVESLLEQWQVWFDMAARHVCVCIVHPWNETEGDELEAAIRAIDKLSDKYPPMVISHRDVLHIHKYWWSLFENVGLYFDSIDIFDKPVMADEFGGNYLDGSCNPALYPTVNESFLRFLGNGHTKELRLQLHTESNARIAEYWRRLGAAGFSPFCIAGSPEDGGHHFLGRLADAAPKPVWGALAAAYSPVSVSLDVWDRNFTPGQTVTLPLHLFNDTGEPYKLQVALEIAEDTVNGKKVYCDNFHETLPGREKRIISAAFTLPDMEGQWQFRAALNNRPKCIEHDVVSSWRFRTIVPKLTDNLRKQVIGVPEADGEITDFLTAMGLKTVVLGKGVCSVAVTGRKTWESFSDSIRTTLESLVKQNCPVVMLDIGPLELGQGYLEGGESGPLQEIIKVTNPQSNETELFGGISVSFTQLPEPESCVHPTEYGKSLWNGLDSQAAWLWNGLKGGLIVPAASMDVNGMNRRSFLEFWKGKAADVSLLESGGYFAYELAGYYAFSRNPHSGAEEILREKVKFLVEDAPALKVSINPDSPIIVRNLSALFEKSKEGLAESIIPLVCCGKSLTRTPVIKIFWGKGRGSLILSQLITVGRLAKGYKYHDIRIDPAAQQMALNMIHDITSS